MRRTLCLMLWTGSLGLTGLVSPAMAFPEPSAAGISWELTFSSQPLSVIGVEGIDGRTKWYWYFSYKVVNLTGEERLFVPKITLASEQGDIIAAGTNVPSGVYQAIKAKLGNSLIEPPAKAAGRLLQGVDFAMESLAVWPVLDHDVQSLTIFVGGLSGESKSVSLGGTESILTKTLMHSYDLPGDVAAPQMQTIVPSSRRWVMR